MSNGQKRSGPVKGRRSEGYPYGGHSGQQPPYPGYPQSYYGYPPPGYYGPPAQPAKISTGLIILLVVVVIIVVSIPFIMAAVLYSWVGGLADTDEGVRLLNLSGMIEVDNQQGSINLSLTHNGGEPIYWSDHAVTIVGAANPGPPFDPVTGLMITTTSVGETVMWTFSNAAETFNVGSQYTVRVIVIETSNIAWQKDITAIYA